jgi:hypothetical protein
MRAARAMSGVPAPVTMPRVSVTVKLTSTCLSTANGGADHSITYVTNTAQRYRHKQREVPLRRADDWDPSTSDECMGGNQRERERKSS